MVPTRPAAYCVAFSIAAGTGCSLQPRGLTTDAGASADAAPRDGGEASDVIPDAGAGRDAGDDAGNTAPSAPSFVTLAPEDRPHVLLATSGTPASLWGAYLDDRPPVRVFAATGRPEVAVTPDGSAAAISYGEHTPGLWLVRFDGRPPVPLVKSGTIGLPTWSPDASRIAYAIMNQDGMTRDVHVIGRDGRDDVRLASPALPQDAHGGPNAISWSADGSYLAVEVSYCQWPSCWSGFVSHGVYVASLDGQRVWLPAPDGTLSDFRVWEWAPVGDLLAYSLGGISWSAGAPETGWDERAGSFFNWAPDGSLLLFFRDGAFRAAAPDESDERIIGPGRISYSCAWSPDSSRIACTGGYREFDYALLVTEADGSRTATGPACQSPSWSPSGTRIACGDGSVVDVPERLGTRLDRVLAPGGADLYRQDWSADSRYLVQQGYSPEVLRDVETSRTVELPGSLLALAGWSSVDPAWYIYVDRGYPDRDTSEARAIRTDGEVRVLWEGAPDETVVFVTVR
jgi:hypothetical protein